MDINLHEDARFAGVLADLKSIINELHETGKLSTLTGSDESNVDIEFGMYGDEKNAEPSILIKIDSPEEFDFDEELLEDFEDFVIGKLEDASLEWSQEVKDSLVDDRLVIVLINGEEY
jgi:hypothetical protein